MMGTVIQRWNRSFITQW